MSAYRTRDYDEYPIPDVTCDYETPKAIHVRQSEVFGDKGEWVPKSVIHENSEVWKKGDKGELVLQSWWGEKLFP